MLELLVIYFICIILGVHWEHKKYRQSRTTGIKVLFLGDKNMGAPTSTGTTNNGNPLFASIQPVQASGANSNGVVSNLAATLSDTTIVTALVKTSASGKQYLEFDTLKVGTVTATITATVTDPDGTVKNFTSVASVVVIPGANDTLTASINVLFSSTVPA